jgi:hypothetical protein
MADTGRSSIKRGFFVRLHPVTWLVVFAIAIRLAADVVHAAGNLHDFIEISDQSWARGAPFWRLINPQIRAFSTTIGYVALAVTVEGLARVWYALRAGRLVITKDAK